MSTEIIGSNAGLKKTGIGGKIALVGAIAVTSAIATTLPAQAAPLDIGGLRFSEISGNFRITGGRLDPNGFVLEQEVFGPDINLFIAIDNFYDRCPSRNTGGCLFTFYSVLTNRTGTPWIFFDTELQEAYGVASPEADGLSFAQGIPEVRPFTANLLGRVDEVTDVRDFVNFSSGIVDPGATVVFRYSISDTTPINRFFLLQRPNFAAGGVGFVDPTPPRPVPPPDPITLPPVAVVPSSEIIPPEITPPVVEPAAAVPEPSTVVGVLLFSAIAAGRSRLKTHR
jgi:hypothetical protein